MLYVLFCCSPNRKSADNHINVIRGGYPYVVYYFLRKTIFFASDRNFSSFLKVMAFLSLELIIYL